jgi:hypothetical protein
LNVVFPPDPELDQATSEDDKSVSKFDSNNKEPDAAIDLLLESAAQRHIRFAYEQANQNQRRAAKIARHFPLDACTPSSRRGTNLEHR